MQCDSSITISPTKLKSFSQETRTNIESTGEILEDCNTKNKPRPWEKKRIVTEHVSEALFTLPEHAKRAKRCADCGTILTFAECENGHKRLRNANFCDQRICPMCTWRRSLKLAVEAIHTISKAHAEDPKLRFVYLVFTQKNVPGDQLKDEITKMLHAWKKLRDRKEMTIVKGWMRTIEVTRNEKTGMWHPHMNVILAVPGGYFSGREYVKQARWRELWQEVMGLDYLPQVNVQAVKMVPSEGGEAPSPKAALELAKYCVKDNDLVGETVEKTKERLEVLVPALHHRKLIDSSGCLKLKKDQESADLVHVEGEDTVEKHVRTCPTCSGPLADHLFSWIGSSRRYVG